MRVKGDDQENGDTGGNQDRSVQLGDTGVIVQSITVVKKVLDEPTDVSGKFNLQIDAITKATDVRNNGTTGLVFVDTGTHTVGEIAGTGTTLSDYTSKIDCANGTIPAESSGTSG